MIYKLSNAAGREQIENEFGLTFKYPKLYNPEIVINGHHESSLCVITMENQSEIDFAIWGLMPQKHQEDWHLFQNINNTLNVRIGELENIDWMTESLVNRRCLVILSGFFTYLVKDGETYPYYISRVSGVPFCLAGVYNTLEDGFLSCALVVDDLKHFTSNYHNLSDVVPCIINDNLIDTWLSPMTSKNTAIELIKNAPENELRANPVAKEFLYNDITFDSLLQPVFYKGIPEGGESSH